MRVIQVMPHKRIGLAFAVHSMHLENLPPSHPSALYTPHPSARAKVSILSFCARKGWGEWSEGYAAGAATEATHACRLPFLVSGYAENKIAANTLQHAMRLVLAFLLIPCQYRTACASHKAVVHDRVGLLTPRQCQWYQAPTGQGPDLSMISSRDAS